MLVSMPVPVSPGLFMSFPGDTGDRGRGLIGSVCEKRQRVRAKVRDGGNPIEQGQGKSFLQETSVMPGQMPTHVYGQDSTHVYGQV